MTMADRPTNEYLTFHEQWPDDKKTALVGVRSARDGASLGIISWYGPWRQYAFHPSPKTTFNPDCMLTIIEYIDTLMEERRASRA